MMIKSILTGIASHIPFLYNPILKGTGGTNSARYCYSVWLRHMILAHNNGMPTQLNAIAELGPGDSIGVGLAALISGVDKYYALDIVEYSDNKRNIEIFYELLDLFRKRENIPDEVEFPNIKPKILSHEFPKHILTDEILNEALISDRIESILHALLNQSEDKRDDIQMSYFVPWYNSEVIKEESIDFIYSHAVLEHVEDLGNTYEAL